MVIEEPPVVPFDADRFIASLAVKTEKKSAKSDHDLVVLPHFTPTEVEALRQESGRRKESFLTPGLATNDEERVRDGAHREAYWIAQIRHLQSLDTYSAVDMAHAREELGNALFVQGRIDDALSLSVNPEHRAYYLFIRDAVTKDDNEFCACPESEVVESVKVNSQPSVSQLWHTVGYYPSLKHGGRMMPIQRCAVCGFTNICEL